MAPEITIWRIIFNFEDKDSATELGSLLNCKRERFISLYTCHHSALLSIVLCTPSKLCIVEVFCKTHRSELANSLVLEVQLSSCMLSSCMTYTLNWRSLMWWAISMNLYCNRLGEMRENINLCAKCINSGDVLSKAREGLTKKIHPVVPLTNSQISDLLQLNWK